MGFESKCAGVMIASGALLLAGGAIGAQAAPPANTFQGTCAGTSPAVCILDEPEGNNLATHGTITVTRTGAVFTFTAQLLDGAGLASGSEPIQLCMVPAEAGEPNPFVPTNANTCAGNHGSPTAYDQFPVVFDAASRLDAPDGDVWFALHVNIQDSGGRTTYVVGTVGGAGTTTTTTSTLAPTTTSSIAPTTTSTVAPTTTSTIALTTTSTVAPTTTSTVAPTTTSTIATTTTLGATTTSSTLAPTTTSSTLAPTTTSSLPATTTTTDPEQTTTTSQATTTTTGGGSTSTTVRAGPSSTVAARVLSSNLTNPPQTTTTLGARVLGAVFEAPETAPTGALPHTGTSPRGLLLTGATLLLLGVLLLLASTRRSPRGVHR